MIFLISIVFIAELIILYNLVLFLIKADKTVCIMAENVEKSRMKLKWRMCSLVEISQGINEIIPILIKKGKNTRRNIMIRILNECIQSIILLFFKPKYKKLLLGIKTGAGMLKKMLKV